MNPVFWQLGARLSAALFLLTSATLFFTPQESDWALPLAVLALGLGAAWLYLRDGPPSLPRNPGNDKAVGSA
ncbi:hypothetical protein MJ904_03360 [Massilia sp. MB5]|uniref:hypothetical protein n=1 Tax=unclassified Massilia TaxID=2609279 RepID=UPI00067BF5E4|nr:MULTISPECIES: hypothetical protein [unclassified Massilia]AKU23769.1 hypothetical protein ACZ75_22230 [Massilia sp. NR 4-1]UMR31294.1 hypothetical protein MJ904_03360 [Massilia sp. MB5]